MNDILTAMVILTPVTIAFVEAAKRLLIPSRWAPLVALACGIGSAFIFPPDAAWRNELAAGILSGLASIGLYSGARSVAQGTTEPPKVL